MQFFHDVDLYNLHVSIAINPTIRRRTCRFQITLVNITHKAIYKAIEYRQYRPDVEQVMQVLRMVSVVCSLHSTSSCQDEFELSVKSKTWRCQIGDGQTTITMTKPEFSGQNMTN